MQIGMYENASLHFVILCGLILCRQGEFSGSSFTTEPNIIGTEIVHLLSPNHVISSCASLRMHVTYFRQGVLPIPNFGRYKNELNFVLIIVNNVAKPTYNTFMSSNSTSIPPLQQTSDKRTVQCERIY